MLNQNSGYLFLPLNGAQILQYYILSYISFYLSVCSLFSRVYRRLVVIL